MIKEDLIFEGDYYKIYIVTNDGQEYFTISINENERNKRGKFISGIGKETFATEIFPALKNWMETENKKEKKDYEKSKKQESGNKRF